MAAYAFVGWNQRGWVDWLGLAAVTVITLPLVLMFSTKKEARSQRRNASR
jgi:hypothetical protein